ncbi:MAG: hypothetical protein KDI13_11395, partial [Alphaproteobacteria bacterium]|nr:hypothetical protein [Alphaproteobacteria bacterium]
MGSNTTASGGNSLAVGQNSVASGTRSTAIGYYNTASGSSSFATGALNTASGYGSVAMGNQTVAGGNASMALGLIGSSVTITTKPQVTGTQSLGIFMGDQDGLTMSATSTMGLFGGKMVIDPAVPATQLTARGVLDVGAATDAIVIPRGTTAQRPGTPVNGMIRYNSTTNKFEGYESSLWTNLTSASPAGSDR